MSPYSENYCNFFDFRNTPRNARYSCKNAGNKLKCGISHAIAAWLTPRCMFSSHIFPGPLKGWYTCESLLLCYSYVSAMVPVKTMKEYDILQEVIVLFSDSVQR